MFLAAACWPPLRYSWCRRRLWQQRAPALFLGGVAVLVLVADPGIRTRWWNGPRRWLDLPAIRVQPSSYMKSSLPCSTPPDYTPQARRSEEIQARPAADAGGHDARVVAAAA